LSSFQGPGFGFSCFAHRITPEDRLGEGNALAKAQANIAAIRVLKACQSGNRPATPEEQAVLAKYTGWGATDLSKLFGEVWNIPANLKSIRAELDELLTPEEFRAAAGSVLNAHYTSPAVVQAMWEGMRRLGLESGDRLLEPSLGSGNFFGLEPADLRKDSPRTGIELDPLTGGIAKLLYPGSDVHIGGFQNVPLPDSFFDAAIGNVPFGTYQVADPEFAHGPVSHSSIH
jgi:hypothetical protein